MRRLSGNDSAFAGERRPFERTHAFIAILRGSDHVFEFVNEAYKRLVGARELIGLTVRQALPEVEKQGFTDLLDRVYRTGQRFVAQSTPVFLQRMPGEPPEELFLNFVYEPLYNANGDISGISVEGNDITLAHQAQVQLEAVNSRYSGVLEAMSEGFILLNEAFHIVEVNAAGVQLSRKTREQLINHYYFDVWPEAIGTDIEKLFRRSMESGEPDQLQFQRGATIEAGWLEVRTYRVPDGLAVFYHDITAIKRNEVEIRLLLERERTARSQAESASKAKDEFLAVLGHELRNPLAPIVTALYLMRMKSPDSTVTERQVIERQVTHMTRLVDDLLDVSRITRGRVEIRQDLVDIRAVVSSAVETVTPLMQERNHSLTVECTVAAVVGDQVRLTQVLINLLTNAARYTPKGGRICLTAARQDRWVVIRVRDNGIGIAPDLLKTIFDVFVQGEQSRERSSGGLGLGLTIVRSLVELHGGEVAALSEGPGKGTELVVRLPAAASKGTAHHYSWDELLTPGERNSTVLLVDDNVDATQTLGRCLEQVGFKVLLANDGHSALTHARGRYIDAAVLDIGLPEMDGYQLAEELRSLPQTRAIPIIALSGYGQDRDRAESQKAGINCHLTKPAEPAMLALLLDRYLKKSGQSPGG